MLLYQLREKKMSKVEVVDGVPFIDGSPAVKIMTSFSEKVGLPQYSSVDIGPISVSRFVADGDEDHLLDEIRKTAQIVEQFIAEERDAVLKMVQDSK